MKTHEVSNQSPLFEGQNLYTIDPILQQLSRQQDLTWATANLQKYGELLGSATWIQKGHQANQYPPKFHSHNSKGIRVDAIEFHPAYHELMALATQYQIPSLPWDSQQPNAHIARMMFNYLDNQNEAGTNCPLTMTFSAVPVLSKHFPLAGEWVPKMLNRQYDPSNKPYFEKEGLTIGMAMTEKQGGTDVRANTTQAVPVDPQLRKAGSVYYLTGHKWFCSAPMCDAFLTLAQTEQGLSCFLFPRWKPNGEKNHFRIQRLKDKLGNKSNASSEIEFDGAFAWLIGEEGRGVPTIIEMVALTRYDCMIGSAALMRRALSEVLHHIPNRKVFGKYLIEQPLMLNVVADLCLESEAALLMAYQVAQCLDNLETNSAQLLLRLLTPIGKFWLTKRASGFVVEAMECLGGNGYIEDSILPRLYREAPVNAIWEGSGNVQCLDVLRALHKSPESKAALVEFLEGVTGKIDLYDTFVTKIKQQEVDPSKVQHRARILVSEWALAVQAALMIQYSSADSALAFCQSRLDNRLGFQYGCIEDASLVQEVVDRNY